MTPIRLKMKNFITYVNEELDFEKEHLTNEVFLINGKTGAGKTTIFDAIMFALYGETSGSGRCSGAADDFYRALHSSYSELTDSTEVEYDFRIAGKNYRAVRKFHFSKNGKLQPRTAELTGDDIEPVNGPEKVNAKCSELLGGLSADQFKQVSMLPQGEFRRFMEADSGERQKILQMLFNMDSCSRYVKLLNAAASGLEKKRLGARSRIEHSMANIVVPEWADAALKDEITPYNIRLTDALTALTEQENERLRLAEERYERAGAEKTRAVRARTAAESDNKLIDAEAEARLKLEKLKAQQESMDILSQETERANRTLRIVRKPMDDVENLEKKQRADIALLEVKAREASENRPSLEKCRVRRDEADAHREEIKQLAADIKKLEEELAIYSKRYGHITNVINAGRQSKMAKEEIDSLNSQKEITDASIRQLEEKLNALRNAETEKANAVHALEAARKNRDDWKSVLDKISKATDLETELFAIKQRLLRFEQDYISKKEIAGKLETAFLRGQAKKLAIELGEDNAVQDVKCKVCGHLWVRGSFALPNADTDAVPDEAQVKHAKDASDSAAEAFNRCNDRATAAQTKLDDGRRAAVESAELLFGVEHAWEELIEESFIDRRSEVLNDEVRRYEQRLAESSKAVNEKDAAEKKLRQEKETLEKIEKKLQKWNEALVEAEKLSGSSKAALENLHVTYQDENEAKRVRLEMMEKQAALEKEIADAGEAYDRAGKRQAALEAEEKERRKNLKKLGEELEEARAILSEALEHAGYSEDLNAAKAAMHLEDANYVAKNTALVERFGSDLRNAEEHATQAAVNAEGKERRDLAELENVVKEVEDTEKRANAEVKELNSQLSMHRSILREVEVARKELDRTESATERIKELREMANKGISFENFALSGDFEEVLDRANDRLTRLSQGRFSLSRSDKGERKNSSAGLGIEITDNMSGRVERCKDISGGEGFLVSMSLALGLSDVAQSRAGGTTVDTIFIDEGFGTLDDEKLHEAVEVLNMLSSGRRTVGIISHVKELEEVIASKVTVEYIEKKGSHIITGV